MEYERTSNTISLGTAQVENQALCITKFNIDSDLRQKFTQAFFYYLYTYTHFLIDYLSNSTCSSKIFLKNITFRRWFIFVFRKIRIGWGEIFL